MDPREPVRRRQHVARATPRDVFDVVVDFPAYPRLFPELKEARVLSRNATPTGELARVEFRAQIVLPLRYVLDLACASAPTGGGPLTIDWTYVEGEIVTSSVGGWRFTAEGDGTAVDYTVSLDVRAPLPGFVLRKVTDGLVSASLPNMFASLEREVRRRQAASGAASQPSSAT